MREDGDEQQRREKIGTRDTCSRDVRMLNEDKAGLTCEEGDRWVSAEA
jgi:hypothetical protein